VTDGVAAEVEHHDSDVDDDTAVRSNNVAASPTLAASAPAFHDHDSGSEVVVWQNFSCTAWQSGLYCIHHDP